MVEQDLADMVTVRSHFCEEWEKVWVGDQGSRDTGGPAENGGCEPVLALGVEFSSAASAQHEDRGGGRSEGDWVLRDGAGCWVLRLPRKDPSPVPQGCVRQTERKEVPALKL